MPKLIKEPKVINSVGTRTKIIKEFFGRVSGNICEISIAQMHSPQGWEEPGQRPEFAEYTVVINGQLKVQTKDKKNIIVESGQGVLVQKGEWVKYSTPNMDTNYLAVCIPAFSNETVNRDS
jgi:quercetin dioxygenase-like cupin family protein